MAKKKREYNPRVETRLAKADFQRYFYERNGKEDEAAHAWDRLSSLVAKHQDWLLQKHFEP